MPRQFVGRAPNQADVARAAGVSTQTVSRVVSGHAYVRPETESKVRAAVAELGYRLHGAAASLASGRTHVIGVIVLSTTQFSSSAIAVGIEAVAAEHGYAVTTATVPNHPSERAFADAFDRLGRQGAEGVVLVAPLDLQSAFMESHMQRIPTVQIERGDAAEQDQAEIARLATEHLLDLGHDTVWHVSGDDDWLESRWRRDAWEAALRCRGITPPPVLPGDWTPESGYRAGRTIAAIPEVTAVFVSSDEMAFGVIRALHEAGRDVPEHVSIVSVDDISLAAYASPALTTVRQPFVDRGRAAALDIIALIEDTQIDPVAHIAPALVIRASTAAPPRQA